MIRAMELLEATSKNGDKLSEIEGRVLFGEAMYEAGMTQVIKEMAANQVKSVRIKDTSEITEHWDKAKGIYDQLFQVLSEDQQTSLYEMFSNLESCIIYSEENGFVEGYFHGYKYVKELR
ncbi:hypothetical protein [Paenibacillus macquariensis]|uniref:DUF4375 domain-containing protein n=1 Tax=Paenibacillus macquariensis TaxID=948756 RepID=A0ABY1KHF4_9BACL|nr:hypothetical protein [Paenibacillus macquariensis]OAB27853.1 hypothetical protein PMSM_24475 [Paenibacillus macquariensis subsp. macquariensis]SIR72471.1 hypothetical protein SAMN05421578_14711 [Paenibacillus macquariensis]